MEPSNHNTVYVESQQSDIHNLTRMLLEALGGKTVQTMAASKDNTAPHRWAHPGGIGPAPIEEQRLRLGYRVWKTLENLHDHDRSALWLLESNPELKGETPLAFIAQLHTREVVAVTEDFVQQPSSR